MLDQLRELSNHPLAAELAGLCALALACIVTHQVTRRFVVRGIEKLILRSETEWDDVLHEQKVFDRLAGLAPAVVAWYGVTLLPDLGEDLISVVGRVAFATMILVGARSAMALLSAGNEIYSRNPRNQSRSIKGYVQVAKIVIAVVAAVLVLATLLDRSPLIFLSGIGAMTAVILLIFRDTILSLVASVQITGNDMVRVGDWIEMPQFGADGDVIDVALHTVKVQNWDKTITTIPTHRLISDSFKNWRYMSLSGGRRIKRSLQVDLSSVRFLSEAEALHLGEFGALSDYLTSKRRELEEHNALPVRNADDPAIRRLTNLGTLRAYMDHYLRAHPRIHKGMTLMVRQLPSGPEGVPLEVYCFTSTTNWLEYEGIQADIFDHFFAIAPQFGIRLFQNPAGSDLQGLRGPGA